MCSEGGASGLEPDARDLCRLIRTTGSGVVIGVYAFDGRPESGAIGLDTEQDG